MSLLQDVLKANIEDIVEGRLYNGRINRTRRTSLEENPDSDDDLVNVVSLWLVQLTIFWTDSRCHCQPPRLVPGHLLPLKGRPRGQSKDRSFLRQTGEIY
jgi:hypothetical protein